MPLHVGDVALAADQTARCERQVLTARRRCPDGHSYPCSSRHGQQDIGLLGHQAKRFGQAQDSAAVRGAASWRSFTPIPAGTAS
jgi:hypothetical protein